MEYPKTNPRLMKKLFYILLPLALLSASLMAQVNAPSVSTFDEIFQSGSSDESAGDDPGGMDSANPGDVPVDGGLSLLLAAGAVYGGRRLYQKKEKG